MPEVTENYVRIPVRDAGAFQKHCRTMNISEGKGIKAIVCRLKGKTTTAVRTYLFAKAKDWTMDKAKKWVKDHGHSISSLFGGDIIEYIDENKMPSIGQDEYNLFVDNQDRYNLIQEYYGEYCSTGNIHMLMVPPVNAFEELKDKIHLTAMAQIVERENVALAQMGLTPQPDMMYLIFKLMHVGVANNNKDLVEIEEAREKAATAILKPIDWEHSSAEPFTPPSGDKKIIGVMFHSELKEGLGGEAPYIEVAGGVYEKKFPKLAQEMRERSEEGELLFSFEIPFETAICSVCKQSFSFSSEYCDHLTKRLEPNSTANRILKDWYISASAVTRKPADEDAKDIVVADKDALSQLELETTASIVDFEYLELDKEKGGNEMAKTYSEEEVATLVKEEVKKALAEVESGKAVAELKTQVEGLETTVAQLTDEKTNLEKQRDEAKEEFEQYKVNIQQETLAASRLESLNIPQEMKKEKEEDLLNALKGMTDEQFNIWKEALAYKKEETEEVEETEEKEKDKEEVVDESQKTSVAADQTIEEKPKKKEKEEEEDKFGLKKTVRVQLKL